MINSSFKTTFSTLYGGTDRHKLLLIMEVDCIVAAVSSRTNHLLVVLPFMQFSVPISIQGFSCSSAKQHLPSTCQSRVCMSSAYVYSKVESCCNFKVSLSSLQTRSTSMFRSEQLLHLLQTQPCSKTSQ